MNITVILITVCFISFLIDYTNEADICGGQNGTTYCVGYQWNDTLGKCLCCKKGLTGFNCTTSYQFPTYGLDCQSICYCSNDKCHFVDGCMGTTITENDSLYRLTSEGSLNDEMETNSQPSKMTIGTIVLATVAFSILLVILFTYRVEKRIRFMNHHSQYA